MILTSGTTWKNSRGEDSWPAGDTWNDLKKCLHVLNAKFSPDKRHIWLTLDPHTYTWFETCSYDLRDNVLRHLSVGGTFEVEADGTIRIRDVKTYRFDENGEPLGAFFYDRWITPDGTEVRRSELHQ